MARTELPNGIILPAEYSDDWYDDMTSNLSKLDDVIGSDADKLSAENVGAAALSNDYADLDNKPTIPTKTSDLTNDSNFVDTSNSAVSSGITSAKVTSYDSHIADTDIHVTTADKNKWNNQSYVFRYSSTALTPSSTNSNALLDNTDNLKVGDKVIDSSGVLFSITAIDTANSTFTIGTALIDLAQDSDVVHNSGNENVNGIKTFKDMIPIDGDYLGNEASTNQRTNICLRSNRDTAGKSCAYITRFRQNRSQGALQTGDLQKIGFDVLENEVRTNNVFDIQCTDWLNDVPQRVNFVSSAASYSWGHSPNKSLINDLNPGALSLPDLNHGIDISSYITVNGGQNVLSTYTAPADGWISINLGRTSGAIALLISNGSYSVSGRDVTFPDAHRECPGILPVFKNDTVTILSNLADSVFWAYFYPCQGNV